MRVENGLINSLIFDIIPFQIPPDYYRHFMQLHSLQIPAGWMVDQNHFYDVSPAEALAGDRLKFPFVQDILHMRNDYRRLALDLGWYPEGDPDGMFRLVLIQWDKPPQHSDMPKRSITMKRGGLEYTYELQPLRVGDPWSHPLVDFSSRDQTDIVAKINETLAKVELGQLGMD